MKLIALVFCLGSLSVRADQLDSLLESARRCEEAIREQAVSIAIPDPQQEVIANTLAYAKAKESFYITLDQVLPEAIDKAARKEQFPAFEKLDEIFQAYRNRDGKEIEAKNGNILEGVQSGYSGRFAVKRSLSDINDQFEGQMHFRLIYCNAKTFLRANRVHMERTA
jgi:hypothetical protein